ncbi:MAG: citrate/tricarballylate utilization protein, partial [Caballeronia sp.]|nr:citrate/tricarballylate utilization protein [Caballeronia sp.]
MQSLEMLTREASALASNERPITFAMTPAEGELSRIMQICNACRYCEGFCAVFPAMYAHTLLTGKLLEKAGYRRRALLVGSGKHIEAVAHALAGR